MFELLEALSACGVCWKAASFDSSKGRGLVFHFLVCTKGNFSIFAYVNCLRMITFSNINQGLDREVTSTTTTSRAPLPLSDQSNVEWDTTLGNQEVSSIEKTEPQSINAELASATLDNSKSLGGILTEVNCANEISVNTSRRNAELLYFCQSTHSKQEIWQLTSFIQSSRRWRLSCLLLHQTGRTSPVTTKIK